MTLVSEPNPVALDAPELYINRELSWLAFNTRVLAQASEHRHPLLERVKFLAIAGSNLDEFFMIRVATLLKQLRTHGEAVSPDGRTTEQQLAVVREQALAMLKRTGEVWEKQLRPELAAHGITFLDAGEHDGEIARYLRDYFRHQVAPVLTPLAFDPGHPFPYISNLSKNLAVVVKHDGRTKFARVKLPPVLPRFIPVPARLAPTPTSFAFLEDVVCANVDSLFPGTTVKGSHLFRVIRDTDMVIQEDEADDLLETIDQGLRQLRHGALSMLQVDHRTPRRVVDILVENFEIEDDGVLVRTRDRMGFGDWMELTTLHRPELKDSPLVPRVVWNRSSSEEVFELVRHRDYMLHHPFDSFTSVETFLSAAVHDRDVVAIKMTLYRIGHDSPLIDLLVQAAEAGKQVAVLVELKARFDERNNITWANRLEAAGVHVVYGLLNLKTHAKLCLIVRKESDGIRRYAHLATGNYNASTARMYTDVGLATVHPDIVDDVSNLFNYLTGYSGKSDYSALLVAPLSLRPRLRALIDREADHARNGRPAKILIKINGLTDSALIQDLYRASQLGVTIDLVVRGICCLRPGVPGVSDRITVRSIVGRFLEHSRIFWFENGGSSEVFIGSADLMERNLDRRVEVLCPVMDPSLRGYLRDVLDLYLSDTERAWKLESSGAYTSPAQADAPVNAQQALLTRHTVDYLRE
ncbi:MAG TPA: polyphosphate kinase 1 [Vicinamibacterales bacterium]|jgi:polyphosphate kinase|nr:polyphosphate kinase 1 [Vicinamibacterales bacterium]